MTALYVNVGLLWLIVIAALLLTLGNTRRIAALTRQAQAGGLSIPDRFGLGIGTTVPDFSAATLTGHTVTLNELASGPVVLAFLSTTCDYCEEQIPPLNESVLQLAEHGVTVAAAVDGSGEDAKALLLALREPITGIFAPRDTSQLFVDYEVNAYPLFYAIGNDRRVYGTYTSVKNLLNGVQELQVSVPEMARLP